MDDPKNLPLIMAMRLLVLALLPLAALGARLLLNSGGANDFGNTTFLRAHGYTHAIIDTSLDLACRYCCME